MGNAAPAWTRMVSRELAAEQAFVVVDLFDEEIRHVSARDGPAPPATPELDVGNSYPLFTLLAFPSPNAVKNETDYPCCA